MGKKTDFPREFGDFREECTQPVDPHEFVFLMNLASGIASGRTPSVDPTEKRIAIDLGDEVKEVSFTNILPNRLAMTIIQNVSSPEVAPAFLTRILFATGDFLRSHENDLKEYVKQDQDPKYCSYHPALMYALARAPLDKKLRYSLPVVMEYIQKGIEVGFNP